MQGCITGCGVEDQMKIARGHNLWRTRFLLSSRVTRLQRKYEQKMIVNFYKVNGGVDPPSRLRALFSKGVFKILFLGKGKK
ncbi:MAG TPA: hypothetical protein DEG69_10895 [Flavobacteriaceae bacterium]|nr:hypothetical protein [Flavobacteriaceae bacterium]